MFRLHLEVPTTVSADALWTVFVSLVLLFSTIPTSKAACPVSLVTGCACTRYFNGNPFIECKQLGSLDQLPSFQTSTTIYESFIVSPVSTTVSNIQESAFNGISVKSMTLSGLAIHSVSVDAFGGINYNFLQELKLDTNYITNISPGTFRGMKNLQALDLSNNQLQVIDKNLFRNLTSMLHLYLFNNYITSLPGDTIFDDLAGQLTILYLYGNQLSQLQNGTLASLSRLEELQLHGNRLHQVDVNALVSLTSLRKVTLQNNKLGGVDIPLNWKIFRNVSNLRNLDLSNNNIRQVTVDAFADMKALNTFTIKRNQLQHLPVGVFNSTTQLQSLDLSDNRLNDLGDGLFSQLAVLTTLYLQKNLIRAISDNTFVGLQALQTLDISGNGIESIPIGAFRSLSQVTSIDISGNELHWLDPGTFSTCYKLTTLSLKNNNIHILPAGVFSNLPSLQSLFLDNNNIPSLPYGMFQNLSSLFYITLTSNRISTVDDGAFVSLRRLMTLYLDNNLLTEFPAVALNSLIQLTLISMVNNSLKAISDQSFINLVNLNRLVLSNNVINQLGPLSFTGGLKKLAYVDLSGNQLSNIPSGLFNRDLTALTTVDLSGNVLSETSLSSKPFQALGNRLNWLDLSDNRMNSIPADLFDGLTSLQTLLLDDNQITTLDSSSFDSLNSLKTLGLSNNRLRGSSLIAFQNLLALTTLELDNNFIDALPDGAFYQCPSLNILRLRNNQLKGLNLNATANLQYLGTIDLGFNALSAASLSNLVVKLPQLYSINLPGNNLSAVLLPDTFVGGEKTIGALDLSNNSLTSDVLFSAIVNLSALNTLILDNNRLTTLPSIDRVQQTLAASLSTLSLRNNQLDTSSISVLTNFTKLSRLNLDGNRISGAFPRRMFSKMFSLTYLTVSNNRLDRLDNETFYIVDRTLSELSLANNIIAAIDINTFSSMTSVKTLDLSGNRITNLNLPPTMPQLNQLTVANNLLTQFPSGIISLPLLLSLDLSGNRLNTLPAFSIHSENTIQLLKLSGNQLTDIEMMTYDGVIGRLDFSNNSLTAVTNNIFNRTKKIVDFDLSYNRFERVPQVITLSADIFSSLRLDYNRISQLDNWNSSGVFRSNIEQLFLRGNQITVLTAEMMNAVRWALIKFDVRDNLLTSINQDVFQNMTHLEQLYLAGNPWNCDCSLSWIRVFESLQSVTIDSAVCVTPDINRGVLVACFNVTDCWNINATFNVTLLDAKSSRCFPTSTSVTTSSSMRSTRSSMEQSSSTLVTTASSASSRGSSSSGISPVNSAAPSATVSVSRVFSTNPAITSVSTNPAITSASTNSAATSASITSRRSTQLALSPSSAATSLPTGSFVSAVSSSSPQSAPLSFNTTAAPSTSWKTITASELSTSSNFPVNTNVVSSAPNSSQNSGSTYKPSDTSAVSQSTTTASMPLDSSESSYNKTGLIVGVILGALALIAIVAVIIICVTHKRAKSGMRVSYDAMNDQVTATNPIGADNSVC